MSAYTLRCWRESASLILVGRKAVAAAATPSSTTNTTVITPQQHGNNNNTPQNMSINNYNVLMLKRSSRMKFFPDVYVFPGGAADEADFSSEWLDILGPSYCTGSTTTSSGPYSPRECLFNLFSRETKDNRRAPIFSRKRDPQFSVIPSDIALRICAIRETFEETGILLARKAGPEPEITLEQDRNNNTNKTNDSKEGDVVQVPRRCTAKLCDLPAEQLNEWRQCVLKKSDNFLKMCRELDLVPDLTALSEWSNWLTPTSTGPRRFDTIFFISFVDHLPDVTVEENESSSHMWQTPTEYFTQVMAGSVNLGPPQVYELNFMNFPSWDSFREEVEYHPHFHAPQLMGVKAKCTDGLLFLFPGDDKYPKNVDLEGNRGPEEFPGTRKEFLDSNTLHHSWDPLSLQLRRNQPMSSYKAQPLQDSIMSLLRKSKL